MIFHDVEQNTDEWQSLRCGKVTASNFGIIMANKDGAFGDPAKRYALQIALERITGKKAEYSFKSDHTDRGHEQEPLARMMYEDESFSTMSNGGFFDHGLYGDSPDGLIGESGVWEAKSVIASVHYDNIRRGSFDPSYKWQLYGHLDCTGREWVDFSSFCAEFTPHRQLVTYRVYADSIKDELKQLQDRRNSFLELVSKIEAEIK